MTPALPSLEALEVVIITTKLTSWRVSVTITISRKPGIPQAISREKEPFRRNTALNRWVVSRPIKSRTCINAIISDSWYCGYQHHNNCKWCFYILLSPHVLSMVESRELKIYGKMKIFNKPVKFRTVIILNIPFLKIIIICKLSPHVHNLCI